MVEERLPTTRISSGRPPLTASVTLGSELSLVSRSSGTSQVWAASSARAGAQAKTTAKIPASNISVAAGALGSRGVLVGRIFVPRKQPCGAGHDQDSRDADQEMQAGAART